MPQHDTNRHRQAIEAGRLHWRSQYMSDGGGGIAAIAYMADHDYELDDDAAGGVIAWMDGDLGRVTVEIDDGGEVAVFVNDRNGVHIWSATASELAPKAVALDMIQSAERSAEVAYGLRVDGKPIKRCRPWSIACTSTDGQYAAGAKSHYSHS